MKKKIVDVGAPQYMAAYTALMIILLAFFIMLNSLSNTKKGGGYSGLGEIQNAFGLEGGFGLFQFAYRGRGGSNAPNLYEGEKDTVGVHNSLVDGKGGSGDTDLESKKNEVSKYLRIKVPVTFGKYSDRISPQAEAELKKIGLGLVLFNDTVLIRCYASDNQDEAKDSLLALRRAYQIMRYFGQVSNVPYENMKCAGYSSMRYFTVEKEVKGMKVKESLHGDQFIYLYIFMKDMKANPEAGNKDWKDVSVPR